MGSASHSVSAGPLPTQLTTLSGWGRTPASLSRLARPVDTAEIQAACTSSAPRGIIARGLGRSYGDSAQRAGGLVLDLACIDAIELGDAGVVRAGAGVSLDRLLSVLVPRGWFVPVTPGTRRVTLGGMVASDIHGKNHHQAGSFGSHVRAIELVDGTGTLRRLTPDGNPAWFWATVGGMGLTGVMVAVEFQAIAIPSAFINVDTRRCSDLDGVMGEMIARDHLYDYTVAWLDLTASGASLGRSVLSRGRFARSNELGERASEPYAFSPNTLGQMPDVVPGWALNRWTAQAFNSAWFYKAPKERSGEITTIGAFFHPLDAIGDWNRAYGPGGFLQWQFVVPDTATDTLRQIIEALVAARCLSFLTVLKRFGPENPGCLSFPMQGWTLTVDVPAQPIFSDLLDDLDRRVVDAGGRLYLAKDSRMDGSLLAAMYPRLEQFREARAALDPQGIFRSDQAVRLGLA